MLPPASAGGLKVLNMITLPDGLYIDTRVNQAESLKSSIYRLRRDITGYKYSIVDYNGYINTSMAGIKRYKNDLKALRKDIKDNPADKAVKTWYAEQIAKIKGLPIKKFGYDTIGHEQIFMFETKPLKIGPMPEEELSYYSDDRAAYSRPGRLLGRFLVIIDLTTGRIDAACLDNYYGYPLPCINSSNCCFGNISGLISQRIREKKIGNLCEIMIDYLTSPTYSGPYQNPGFFWRERKHYKARLSWGELCSRFLHRYSVEYSALMIEMLKKFTNYPVNLTPSRENKRLGGAYNRLVAIYHYSLENQSIMDRIGLKGY